MNKFALLATITAALALTAIPAEARSHKAKKRGEVVVKVKPRSYLDAGTSVLPGTYQGYSLGQTPHRAFDSYSPTGSAEQRLLPGRFGL
jgi:hypothetical protein